MKRRDLQISNACALWLPNRNDGRQQLAEIAEQRVLVPSSKRPLADCFWIVVGFALDDGQFETKLKEAAPMHPDILWIIRSLTKSPAQTDHPNVLFELSLHQCRDRGTHFWANFPEHRIRLQQVGRSEWRRRSTVFGRPGFRDVYPARLGFRRMPDKTSRVSGLDVLSSLDK